MYLLEKVLEVCIREVGRSYIYYIGNYILYLYKKKEKSGVAQLVRAMA